MDFDKIIGDLETILRDLETRANDPTRPLAQRQDDARTAQSVRRVLEDLRRLAKPPH